MPMPMPMLATLAATAHTTPSATRHPTAESTVVWIDGRIVGDGGEGGGGPAAISVLDHGLLYGDGVFEGIRYYGGKSFRLDAHLDRLDRSAAALRLTLPYDRAGIAAAVATVIAHGDATGGATFDRGDGYLRLIVTRGPGTLGLDPRTCGRATMIVIRGPVALFGADGTAGITVVTAATRQPGADVLDPRVKSLNYLPRVLARLEAAAAGADEAILLNHRGLVTEATTENVFVVAGGVLRTPPATDGALEGITRQVVLELAAAAGIPAEVVSLGRYDLHTADEIFLAGTAAELVAVRAVDGRALPACPGPVFARLAAAFRALVSRPPDSPG